MRQLSDKANGLPHGLPLDDARRRANRSRWVVVDVHRRARKVTREDVERERDVLDIVDAKASTIVHS